MTLMRSHIVDIRDSVLGKKKLGANSNIKHETLNSYIRISIQNNMDNLSCIVPVIVRLSVRILLHLEHAEWHL